MEAGTLKTAKDHKISLPEEQPQQAGGGGWRCWTICLEPRTQEKWISHLSSLTLHPPLSVDFPQKRLKVHMFLEILSFLKKYPSIS